MELSREPKSLDGLVAASVDQVRQQAEARRIKLIQSLPDESIVCNVDAVRIQQVLANLLNNAVKFTPEEGEIRVSLSLVDRPDHNYDAQIEVADTGIGIAPEFLPHVFDRFAQAHGGINQHYGGLGLGLAITRAMVEMHGGQVEARSEGLGRGSRFIVRLPGVRIEGDAGPEHSKGAASRTGAPGEIGPARAGDRRFSRHSRHAEAVAGLVWLRSNDGDRRRGGVEARGRAGRST